MKYKTKDNILITNPEYNILYQTLIKEARMWNNSGQYWLGKEAEKKALTLLNGNIDEALVKFERVINDYPKTNR